MQSSTPTFRFHTEYAYTFKIWIELLNRLLDAACFEIHPDKIVLQMTDKKATMVHTELLADRFKVYELNSDKVPLHIGFNLNNLHKTLKSVKKNDSISFEVNHDQTKVTVRIFPLNSEKIEVITMNALTLQSVHISLPGYPNENKHSLCSHEYQRAIKNLHNIPSHNVQVGFFDETVVFKCSANDIYSKTAIFGPYENEQTAIDRSIDYNKYTLHISIKIAALGKRIKLYPGGDNLPLGLETDVGKLGTIRLFIRSNDQLGNRTNMLDTVKRHTTNIQYTFP